MIRTGLIWSGILIAIMVGMSLYGQMVLPADAEIAIHWGINGEPDGYAGKTQALWMIPAIALGTSLLMIFIPLLEPRKKNLAESRSLFLRGWIGALLLLLMVQGIVLLSALGVYLPVIKLVIFVFGFFLILMGNILGKSQSNFFVGIKTPWTLSSDVAWDKTHRLAGRLWVLTGIILPICALLLTERQTAYVALALLPFTMIGPVIMSYFYWRADKSVQTEEA